ncbi:MAG: hypothetical protein AABW86_01070 [Candidatus Micrarchaeota archaeon]
MRNPAFMSSIIVLLLFLLVVPPAFSDSSSTPSILGFDMLSAVFPIVAMIMIVILAMLYMASQMFSLPALNAWVKTEIKEFIVGAIVVAIVLGVFFGTTGVVSILTGKDNPEKAAQDAFKPVTSALNEAYHDVIRVSQEMTLLAGYSYNFAALPLFYFNYTDLSAPYSGVGQVLSALSQSASAMSNALMVYLSLSVLMQFFSFASLVILPFALSLRIIPFTRQLGSTLIALSIGGYILLPASIIIVGELHSLIEIPKPNLSDSQISNMHMEIPVGFGAFCESDMKWFAAFGEIPWGIITCIPALPYGFWPCFELVTKVIYPDIMEVFQLVYGWSFYATAKFMDVDVGAIYDTIAPFLQEVGNLVVISYVDTILVALLTIITVKGVSTALGGEYFMAGIQRLV